MLRIFKQWKKLKIFQLILGDFSDDSRVNFWDDFGDCFGDFIVVFRPLFIVDFWIDFWIDFWVILCAIFG